MLRGLRSRGRRGSAHLSAAQQHATTNRPRTAPSLNCRPMTTSARAEYCARMTPAAAPLLRATCLRRRPRPAARPAPVHTEHGVHAVGIALQFTLHTYNFKSGYELSGKRDKKTHIGI
ncbi:hypothetical protein EVAR_74692_1 [Eumeta japonica]|uniref:Uncharacterized protein n=1 Tax=Eumeta variegata TaxID=151549 RepID=A0A4C1YM84_EUMVA|nr:hypothetical protein EVAR_74692_1 [Eumeta japonica]